MRKDKVLIKTTENTELNTEDTEKIFIKILFSVLSVTSVVFIISYTWTKLATDLHRL